MSDKSSEFRYSKEVSDDNYQSAMLLDLMI